jgi:signal transduction histidine kinase
VNVFSRQPLKRLIVVATGGFVLVLGLVAGWSAYRTLREERAKLGEEAGTVATLAASYLNQYFDGLDATASVLLREPAVVSFDDAQSARLFETVVREQPLILNVALRDRTGKLRASGATTTAGRQPGPAPPYLFDVMRTGQAEVSELSAAPVTGQPTIGQAYPVRSADGSVVGVLALGLNVLQLQKVFQALPLPDQSVVTLVDSHDRILARSIDGQKYIGQTLRLEGLKTSPDGLLADVDGADRWTRTAPVERGRWVLAVGIPRYLVVERLRPLWSRNLTVVTLGVLLVFVLGYLMSTRVAEGLNRLRAAAQSIADGDLSPPVASTAPSLEIAQLQEAFSTMAAKLRETHGALDRQVEQERKMREMVQSLQRQVVRQERLAAVGVLVSGVAHELNNPLQAILGTAELLEQRPDMSEPLLEEIGFLKTQSARASEIIRNLSRFSSPQSGPPTLVDLRDVITEVIQLRQRDLAKSSISLDVEASASGKVFANATELEQVTLNFVINAQQAIEGTDRPTGRILIRLCDEGRKVRLDVQDDGPGVPTDDEPKLFQPFFTTKPAGKGTGLGLSVSYGIIESYGGTIGHRPNEWGGATFFFELPVALTPDASG